jgi:tRNA (cmo5U34)-methyltransferase
VKVTADLAARVIAFDQRIREASLSNFGLDFSEIMVREARARFEGNNGIEFVRHDLATALPPLGSFDAVVSSFAIHHLEDERKRELYREAFDILKPEGIFANFEHVSSSTERLHRDFFKVLEVPIEDEDPSDRLLDVETQLRWLRGIGFDDVDCYWKWREMALLAGRKPA